MGPAAPPLCTFPAGGIWHSPPITRISQVFTGGDPDNHSSRPSLSADGRFVAFASSASDIVVGDTLGFSDVFVRDRLLNITTRVSVGLAGAWGNQNSDYPSISADGRYVAFDSSASNLVGSTDTNNGTDTFVHDRVLGTTTRVSVATSGAQGTNIVQLKQNQPTAISPDGRYVAFLSYWPNLVTPDGNSTADLFVRDRTLNTTIRASYGAGTTEANKQPYYPDISADGRYVSWLSHASNLVGGDTNGVFDAFVRDTATATTSRVSLSATGTQVASVYGAPVRMSDDARYVAFSSNAADVVTPDANGLSDVFVRDRTLGMTARLTRDIGGGDPDGDSFVTSISADGRYVTFFSYATDLVPGDTNALADVFISDRLTNTVSRASLRVGQTQIDGQLDGHSYNAELSGNGRFIGMVSDATNFGGTDANGKADVYLVDRGASTGGLDLSPSLLGIEAQSDQLGLEQFMPYSKQDLGGSGTAYTNLNTGNLVAQFTDASIPGQGLNTVLRRTYNSKGRTADNGLGLGWSLSVSDVDAGADGALDGLDVDGAITDLDLASPIKVSSFGEVVSNVFQALGMVLELTDGDGTTHRFVRKGGPCGRWESPPGVSLRVREDYDVLGLPVAYELIRPDGVTYRVEPRVWPTGLAAPSDCNGTLPTATWQITSVKDRNGNQLSFCYKGYGVLGKLRLRSIAHNRVSTPTSPLVRLDYTTTGDLDKIVTLPGVSSLDPASGVTRSWERWIDATVNTTTRQLTSVVDNAHTLPSGALDGRRTTSFTYDATTKAMATVVDGRLNTTSFGFTSDRQTLLTDRRGKVWGWIYGSSPGVPSPTTLAFIPVATSVNATVLYDMSPRAQISASDKRMAGGNVTRITDAGHGSPTAAIVTNYAWEANRLVTVTIGAGAVTRTKYNDLGLVTEVTEPSPNDPARAAELPTGAPTTPVISTLSYRFPPSQPRYAAPCTPPASGSTPSISTAGWCEFTAELERAAFATNVAGQLRTTDFVYTEAGNLSRATERAAPSLASDPTAAPGSGDRSTGFTYYDRGGLKTIDGPRTDVADLTTFGNTADATYGGYDRTGMATTVLDALSKTKTYVYTPYGLTAQITDRDARVTKSRYDERNNLREVTDPSARRTDYFYDANDNKTKETSPRGTATATVDDFTNIFTFDTNDWMTQASEPGITSASPRVINGTTYFDDGSKSTETGPRGGVTTHAYWPNRLVKSTTAPAGTGQTAVTEYFYDVVGRVNKTVHPVANAAGNRPESLVTFTPDGDPSVQRDTSSDATALRTVRSAYNAHRETIETAGPRTVGGVEALTVEDRDVFGQVLQSRRRLTASKWVVTSYSYDLAGNQRVSAQPIGDGGSLNAEYTFDALNRLAGQPVDPSNPGHTVEYAYNGEGQQLERSDKVSGVLARKSAYVYNPDNTQQSHVISQYDGAGTPIETLASCNWAAGAGATTGYDADGNLLVSRTVTGTGSAGCAGTTALRTQTFNYFDTGWISSSTQTVRSPLSGANVSRTQSFTYELDEERLSVTHNGAATSYVNSLGGFNEKVTDWRSRISEVSYVASGAPALQKLNDDAIRGTFVYHKDGAPESVVWSRRTSPGVYQAVRSHTGIHYDIGGLRGSESVQVVHRPGSTEPTGGNAGLTHDLLDRLKTYTSPYTDPTDGKPTTTYTLDDAGNITTEAVAATSALSTTTSAYPANRLSGRTIVRPAQPNETETLTYTGLGEEATRIGNQAGSPTKDTATTYDPAGHVERVDDRKAGTPADVDYVYDTADRVISRVETKSGGAQTVTLYFYWSTGGSLAEETDALGNTMVRYLLDANDEHIAQESWRKDDGTRDTVSTWSWLLPDSSGNTATQLLDDGTVTEQAAFDPYGKPDAGGGSDKAGTAKPTTMGFQGAISDKTTGGVILGARIYDPTTARFTTPDTFVAGELDMALGTDTLTGNRYLFAAANPTAFYDDGHWGFPKIKIKIPSPVRALKKLAKAAVPALGFVPIVGTAIDVVSAATGRDLLNGGKKLSGADRLMLLGGIALGVATGGAAAGAIKGLRAVAKAADKGATLRAGLKAVSHARSEVRAGMRASDGLVDLTTARRRGHILHGDATGGGHLWPGLPGKSPFPRGWSGRRILHEISDVATDPVAERVVKGGRTIVTGTRDGVKIRVVIDNRTGEIITGYPTNVPRNH